MQVSFCFKDINQGSLIDNSRYYANTFDSFNLKGIILKRNAYFDKIVVRPIRSPCPTILFKENTTTTSKCLINFLIKVFFVNLIAP